MVWAMGFGGALLLVFGVAALVDLIRHRQTMETWQFVAWAAVIVDPDAIVSVFADEIYFKGLGPYAPERTDKAAMHSYAESMVPLHIRIERSSEITPTPDGPLTLTVVIQSDEITPRLTWVELEVQGDKISLLKTLDSEKTDQPIPAHIGTCGRDDWEVVTAQSTGWGRRWLRHMSGVMSRLGLQRWPCGALE